MDFTIKKYEELCLSLKSNGYNFYGIRDFLTADVKEPFVILRHDVDRSPRKAQIIADIEQSLGIKSTYNFRTKNKKLFDIKRMKYIQSLNHEIAYHYEVLVQARGDISKALIFFKQYLEKFRYNSIKIDTATFHGSPFSKFDSREIWNQASFESFVLKAIFFCFTIIFCHISNR